jgi:hypothetical protein
MIARTQPTNNNSGPDSEEVQFMHHDTPGTIDETYKKGSDSCSLNSRVDYEEPVSQSDQDPSQEMYESDTSNDLKDDINPDDSSDDNQEEDLDPDGATIK